MVESISDVETKIKISRKSTTLNISTCFHESVFILGMHEKKFFTVKVVELEEVVQRCCGVFILGDIQNLTGHSPKQSDVDEPA